MEAVETLFDKAMEQADPSLWVFSPDNLERSPQQEPTKSPKDKEDLMIFSPNKMPGSDSSSTDDSSSSEQAEKKKKVSRKVAGTKKQPTKSQADSNLWIFSPRKTAGAGAKKTAGVGAKETAGAGAKKTAGAGAKKKATGRKASTTRRKRSSSSSSESTSAKQVPYGTYRVCFTEKSLFANLVILTLFKTQKLPKFS